MSMDPTRAASAGQEPRVSEHLGFTHAFLPASAPGLPTLVLLHGTGGDERDLLPLGRMLAPGAALLSPRGKVSEQGMARYFRRLAEGVFDEHDLIARTHELAAFLRAAAAHYGLDAQSLVAVGFSNGANIAASTLLLEPGVLAGAVLLHPMVPLRPASLPQLGGTPVFIGAGRADPIAPPDEAEGLAEVLRAAGANVTLNWQPGGHTITAGEARAAVAWLRESFLATDKMA